MGVFRRDPLSTLFTLRIALHCFFHHAYPSSLLCLSNSVLLGDCLPSHRIDTAAALLWCSTHWPGPSAPPESGLWVGHFTKRYLIPLLLKAADGLSYLNAQIDWDHVRTTLRMVITTAVAAVITLFTVIIPAAYLWIERNFIDVPVASERPAPCKSTQPAARGFAPVQRRRHGRLIAC